MNIGSEKQRDHDEKVVEIEMNFLNHYCFKQLFSGGIEPPTSA